MSKIDFSIADKIIDSYGRKQSSLIAIMQDLQAEFHYLPQEILEYIAKGLDISIAKVYGVATFYENFSLEPKGKYVIKICDGTACHVRGSMPVYESVVQRFKLTDGKYTTEDGMFSVETVSCLGACGLAPVVVVNGKVYPQMTTDAMKVIIDTILEREKEQA